MSFAEIKDQDVSLRHLRQVLLRGRFPNGLLFWGPEGVGKRTTALAFAKALLCTESKGDACGQCLACRKVAHGNHPDLKVIKPSGKTRIYDVDSIEELIDLATYRPYEAAWRIFIILDADRIAKPSQNHFLKTLEEPPSATIFLLVSEKPRRLLPTIRSRCQHVRFGALRSETISYLLSSQRNLPESAAVAIGAVSQGQMSFALDFVDTGKREVVINLATRLAIPEDPLLLSEEFADHLKAEASDILTRLKEEDTTDLRDLSPEEREKHQEEIEDNVQGLLRQQITAYLYLFAAWYRDLLLIENGIPEERLLYRDQLETLRRSLGGDHTMRIAEIERAQVYIDRNLNRDRVFRDLFFRLGAVKA